MFEQSLREKDNQLQRQNDVIQDFQTKIKNKASIASDNNGSTEQNYSEACAQIRSLEKLLLANEQKAEQQRDIIEVAESTNKSLNEKLVEAEQQNKTLSLRIQEQDEAISKSMADVEKQSQAISSSDQMIKTL